MPQSAQPARYWPLGQMILSRLKEFLREPEALFWVYGFPILMVAALGVAFRNQPVEQIVVDIVAGPAAEATRAALASPAIPERFKVQLVTDDEASARLRTGKSDLIVIPDPPPAISQDGDSQSAQTSTEAQSQQAPSAEDQPSPGDRASPPRYEYRFDPTRPQSVLARAAVDDQLQRAAGRRDIAEVTLTAVDEPGGRYIDFLVPGLLGMSLMGGGLWGVGFVIVDMRVRKLLKRFLATPMKRSEFLAAIMGSRMLFMVPEVLILLLFARYVCGVVNHGSILAVTVLVLLGAVMFSGIGLLLASRAKTIEAVSGMMNLAMIPMWIFSGIFFSSERFPEAAQPFIKAIPLTPLIDSLRNVMLEGASLAGQAIPIAIMSMWAVVSYALALRIFRWL